jgi:hypothetical protein
LVLFVEFDLAAVDAVQDIFEISEGGVWGFEVT